MKDNLQKESTLPCKTCLLLPCCKNKNVLNCEQLYKYLCYIIPDDHVIKINGKLIRFGGYRQGHGNHFTKLFKKYVRSTSIDNNFRIKITKRRYFIINHLYNDK